MLFMMRAPTLCMLACIPLFQPWILSFAHEQGETWEPNDPQLVSPGGQNQHAHKRARALRNFLPESEPISCLPFTSQVAAHIKKRPVTGEHVVDGVYAARGDGGPHDSLFDLKKGCT